MMSSVPYVFVYSEVSIDGKTAPAAGHSSLPMMQLEALEIRRLRHTLRACSDGIVVGSQTAAIDDPQLTVRYVEGRNPLRVVVDSQGSLPLSGRILTDGLPTAVFVADDIDEARARSLGAHPAVRVVRCGGPRVDAARMLGDLARNGVRALMVEGGGHLIQHLLSLGLIDAIIVQSLPVVFGGEGLPTLAAGPRAFPLAEAPRFRLLRAGAIAGHAVSIYVRAERHPVFLTEVFDRFASGHHPGPWGRSCRCSCHDSRSV